MYDINNDSGVSPVIGVILMVAVTVALVALVTVVVFDIGGDVSESPDATVQLEESGGSVTATVLRNENVQDFTLQGVTDSGSTTTQSLSGDSGSTRTISGITTTSSSVEEYGENHTNGVSAPIQSGDQINLNNSDFDSFNQVDVDTTQGDGVNYDTTGVSSFTSVDDANSIIEYDGTQNDVYNVRVDYNYQTGTDSLSEVQVLANMPDGSTEVLTSTNVEG